ncbi:MAG: hypothetical protein ACW986_01465 [Promethearchaeota archaeon]|jgi:hypothetical protein
MPEFEKIIQNFQPAEVTANFFILYKDEVSSLDGVISFEEDLEKFIELVLEEIEYSWGSEYAKIDEFSIFYIDVEEKNNLKEITDEEIYQHVRTLKEIFILMLHKEIKYRIIENLPPVFEWFMAYSL